MNNQISVVVITYNSELKAIILTLESIIRQKNINLEIIVSDDGSKVQYEKELKAYFESKNFTNYQLLLHKENQGTVKNVFDGVKHAKYENIKVIGAGDLLYKETILDDVVIFMNENKLDYAFTDAVYFFDDGKEIKTTIFSQPVINKPYNLKTYNQKKIEKNIMLLNDFVLGASIFYKKDAFMEICDKLQDKIKYEEDAIVTASFLTGRKIAHYEEYGVYYEHGSGLSLNFANLLYKDSLELFDYLKDNTNYKRMNKALKLRHIQETSKKQLLKKILIYPPLFFFKVKMQFIKKKEANYDFYRLCKDEADKYEL